MQNVSALYNEILADSNHWFEARLVIDDIGTFTEEELFSMRTSLEMFSETPTVGMAVAGQIDVEMILPSATIPEMGVLRPQIRACTESAQSEWIPQGVYYVDTRSYSKTGTGTEMLTLHGYDAMLRGEQPFISAVITGDSVDTDMVDEIASIMGVEVDERTYDQMGSLYTVPLPTAYSCREVLGYIAGMYVGAFIMTDEGKLRLVSLLELPETTDYIVDGEGDPITFGGDRILWRRRNVP